MIKCNYSECSIQGNSILVQAEFSLICKCVRESFVTKYGEATGMEQFKRCLELSEMSEEEIENKNKEMIKNNPLAGVLTEEFMKFILGGDSSCNAEEEE